MSVIPLVTRIDVIHLAGHVRDSVGRQKGLPKEEPPRALWQTEFGSATCGD